VRDRCRLPYSQRSSARLNTRPPGDGALPVSKCPAATLRVSLMMPPSQSARFSRRRQRRVVGAACVPYPRILPAARQGPKYLPSRRTRRVMGVRRRGENGTKKEQCRCEVEEQVLSAAVERQYVCQVAAAAVVKGDETTLRCKNRVDVPLPCPADPIAWSGTAVARGRYDSRPKNLHGHQTIDRFGISSNTRKGREKKRETRVRGARRPSWLDGERDGTAWSDTQGWPAKRKLA
jgi:hypothetical protein